ncbi:MAG: hypothetical protein ABSG69_11915 [Candidatus Acidiferrum sp.]|jgi:hypothetical protein
MPENISSTRIEPLGSGVREGVDKEEYAPTKERRKLKAEAPQAAAPVVEVEGEEKHQLDERA